MMKKALFEHTCHSWIIGLRSESRRKTMCSLHDAYQNFVLLGTLKLEWGINHWQRMVFTVVKDDQSKYQELTSIYQKTGRQPFAEQYTRAVRLEGLILRSNYTPIHLHLLGGFRELLLDGRCWNAVQCWPSSIEKSEPEYGPIWLHIDHSVSYNRLSNGYSVGGIKPRHWSSGS